MLLCLFLLPGLIEAQTRQIKGTVISAEDKEPLIGATVIVKGSLSGTETDIDGNFTIDVGPDAKTILIDYIGMVQAAVPVPKNDILNVALKSKELNLEEVVVTGYGNFTKSSFTGSANTLRADMLKNVPVVSVEQKLQGMTTGVNITSGSGQPGAVPTIRIRGMGSLTASNEPLYVIDGVPVTTGSMSNLGAYMNNAKTSIMSTLNPSDIENITVIKDAAAASLYGSRAANGVILITTKKGRTGRTQVTFRADGGFSDLATDFRPSLNGTQRRELLYEGMVNFASMNPGLYPDPQAYADAHIDEFAAEPWSGYTNWKDVLLRTATHQNYEVSATGGSDKTTFYASLAYNNQEGVVHNSNMDRYSARLNVTQKVGSRGELGANVMFSQVNQEMNEERTSASNPFFAIGAKVTPSYYPYNEDGSFSDYFPGNESTRNPLRDALLDYSRNRLTRIFSTGYASVDLLKGLKLKEILSYDYTTAKDAIYFNPMSGAGIKSGNDAMSQKGFNEYGKLISSTSLNYVKKFNKKHNLDVLVAFETEQYNTDKAEGSKSILPSELLFEPDNASQLLSFASSTSSSRMISYISRANYDYDGRYYLAASFRRDGTSRLSPQSRWGNFWSVSGMWQVSDEAFMQKLRPVLSDLKLRASYGVNGNQPGGLYGYMGLYSYGKNYNGNPGSYESSMPNPDLGWEKNYSLNLGIDFGLFNRVNISLEYYNRDTKDLLYSMPISMTTGFGNYLANIGQINNKGVELEVRSTNITNNYFNWNTVLNLAHNANKIVALDGKQEQSISTWFIHKVGLPYNSFYVKEFAGVDPQTGDALYYINSKDEQGNYDKSTTSDPTKANAIPYKQVDPKISGGLTNILSYRDFDLSFTFTYQLGGYSFDKTATYIETDGANEYSRNIPVYFENRWQKPGDITDIPRFVQNQPNILGSGTGSSRFVHSTDHLRLKNLTFGYTLPHKLTDKILLQNVRTYFSGSNLLTWAKWKQYDPEVPINGEVNCEAPALRTFSFGVEVTF